MKVSALEVSVIIPTYNRAGLLPRALDSLLRQSFANWEAVIADDGSTDRTRDLVSEYSVRDPRFRYFFQENGGLSSARNFGISHARAPLLTFLDSDDEYAPEHLARRVDFMNANPGIDLIHGGIKIIGGSDTVPDRERPGEFITIADCFVGGTFFMGSVVPRELGGFRKPDFGDDYEFIQRAMKRFNVTRVSWPTYIYHRETPDSMCNIEAQRRNVNG